MLTSSRDNRLSSTWRCPHCRTAVDARTFRLDPGDATQLVCLNAAYAKSFAWKRQTRASSGRSSGPAVSCGDWVVHRYGELVALKFNLLARTRTETDADREDSAELEAQGRPIPAEGFPLPACPAGMVLLKTFADADPHSFEFIQPEDFVHFENEALLGVGEWNRIALSCYACQEL